MRTPTIRAVRRTLESGRTTGGEPLKASFVGSLRGLSVAVVMAPPMIVGLRCKSPYPYGVRKSRAAGNTHPFVPSRRAGTDRCHEDGHYAAGMRVVLTVA